MENNKLRKLCGNINYNAYTNLENIFGVSTLGLGVASQLISQNNLLNNSIETLGFISLATYLGLALSHGKNYTKDINQIRELYQEFIKNYNKLNKIFDLNNPVQIHTMFNYLLYKGYLSKDKQFVFSDTQARDIDLLSGANVITGYGISHHISSMLTGILKDYGIEAGQLGIYSDYYALDIKILDEPRYTKEELFNWARTHITDENIYNFTVELIEMLIDEKKQNIELSYKTINSKSLLKRKNCNHAISFAFKDGKSYFLDPTHSRIYRMSDNKKGILYDDISSNILISTAFTIALNKSKDFLKTIQMLSGQCESVSKEEEKEMIAKTFEICNGNIDIFEQFYNQNNELYNDISSKILKIKK